MESQLILALESFIGTIEATGGIYRDRKGWACPVGDPEWIDLGEAYLQACRALKREVLVADEEKG
jgi:hypothetical protein